MFTKIGKQQNQRNKGKNWWKRLKKPETFKRVIDIARLMHLLYELFIE